MGSLGSLALAESATSSTLLIARDGTTLKIERASKLTVANRILDEVVKRL